MAGSFLFKKKLTAASPARGDEDSVPEHIAIIMDGNNRWAKKQLIPGVSGHKAGVETIRKVLSVCEEYGVGVLTLFAFSSENWQRPENEVQELMRLLKTYLQNEVNKLHEKGIAIRFIGRRDRLDSDVVEMMQEAEAKTAANTVSTLVLAIDYGGRWDIANAARRLAEKVSVGDFGSDAIDETAIAQYMALNDLPSADLCIRTGGDHRISNFLLWQLSYAELYFCDCYWPDFDEDEMHKAIADFAMRQRRFGRTAEQVQLDAAGESGHA